MPSANQLEWPQGQPLFETMWRAISEALAGNGVVQAGDLEVTATANANEITVASGTVFYQATEYSTGGGTFQLTDGDGTYDRWDTVYFDTATSTAGVREGTAETDPEPPDITGDEVLLAVIYVPQNATDTTDSDILNWRATFSNEAEEVHFDDPTGDYGVTNVEAALDTIDLDWVRGRDNTITGLLASLGTNPGVFGRLVDATVDSNSSAGTQHSYQVAIDGQAFVQVYAESDGAGGIQNARVDMLQDLRLDNDLLSTSGTTIWDSANGVINQAVLGGPASSLTSYPLPIGDLDSPYPLPDITDMDADGTDLTDSTAGATIWDAVSEWVPREQIEDRRTVSYQTASGTNGSYLTQDEEAILVDTATNSTPFTVTLASADAEEGNPIIVADQGGGALNNNITVNTEGGEQIDGENTLVLDRGHSAAAVISDGTNWFATGGVGIDLGLEIEDDGTQIYLNGEGIDFRRGLTVTDDGDQTVTLDVDHQNIFEGREGGDVPSGDQGILIVDSLADGESVQVYKAALLNADGSAVASSVDLELVTMDNAGGFTSQDVLLTGDGSTVYDDETGNPLGIYQNTSGASQTIAVLVDNGTAGTVTIMASVEGVTGL